MAYSVMEPLGVMRPILLPSYSVNQRFPSDPLTRNSRLLLAVGTAYSVMEPLGVMRPI